MNKEEILSKAQKEGDEMEQAILAQLLYQFYVLYLY